MSTRATIWFHNKGAAKPEAIIYRHSDGYPEGLGADLKRFVAEVKSKLQDTRFSDPSYLAAKWVVFDADQHNGHYLDANETRHPLNFLSVGICRSDPGDIEYRYHVVCDGNPTIWGEEVDRLPPNYDKLLPGKKVTIPEPEPITA